MLPDRLARVVQLLARLPGVGEKTAQRFALHLVTCDEETPRTLGVELTALRDHLRPCDRCGNVAEAEQGRAAICAICSDSRRESGLVCVVARVQDLLAIERSGAMRGRYFVLGRLLSPLEGIGPEDLPIATLKRRLDEAEISEVVVATPPSVDGEATALLLA